MKAITYAEYGPPEVLRIEEVDKPEPAEHEVLVRVRAAEATKSDCELRSFKFSVKWFWLPLRLAFGIRRPRRRILGGYFSGEIAAIGKSVERFAVGDAIYGATSTTLGAYGEYLTLPADAPLAPKPINMTFAEAAAVPLGGLNALHFMTRAHIRPGDEVLILGAGGSIGGHAVQIAKAMGATITAVDHGKKRELIQRLGADHFIDYTTQDIWTTGRRYDVIFDMVPTTAYSSCMNALKPDGRYLCGNPRLSVMMRSMLTNAFSRRAATFAFAPETRDALDELRRMIEAGEIRPFIDRIYPMTEAAQSHHRVETEDRIGTVVLAMGDDG